jgi:hypothetical protein
LQAEIDLQSPISKKKADTSMTDIDKHNAPPEHTTLLERQKHNRWWYLERVAMGLIALGALMMFQPFTIVLFTYSYIVILAGVILFTIVSRMAD